MADRKGGGAVTKAEPVSPPAGSETSTSPSYSQWGNGTNGYNGVSEDSMDSASNDAPLDFSMKKADIADYKSREEEIQQERLSSQARSVPPSTGRINERYTPQPHPSERHTPQQHPNGISLPHVPTSDESSDGKSSVPQIGEPRTALPGMLPGMTLPGAAGQGLAPGFPAFMPASGIPAAYTQHLLQEKNRQAGGGKSSRPFKSYPKDPLSLPLGYFGLPGMSPLQGIDMQTAQALSINSEEMFKHYRDYMIQAQEQLQRQSAKHEQPIPVSSVSPPLPQQHSHHLQQFNSGPLSSGDSTPTTSSPVNSLITTSPASSRKRGRILPDGRKDESYWERRRKNNEAAKRSRDARRAKEDEIAIRAAFLEQENLKLRVEVAALKNETAKLRCMLYNS